MLKASATLITAFRWGKWPPIKPETVAPLRDGRPDMYNHTPTRFVSKEEAKAAANEDDRSFAEGVDDATLAAEIKIELLAHDELSGLAIDVDARDTTVTLSGKVESDARKKLAEQVVQNVDGVTSVENNLLVATS